MSLADFVVEIAKYAHHRCPRCGGNTDFVLAHLSIHTAEFSEICAGPGRVLVLPIPYCPKCEEPPADRGCLHAPMAYMEPVTIQAMGRLIEDCFVAFMKT